MDGHPVPGLLTDRLPQIRLQRKLVPPVAQGHERALERVAIDGATNLHPPSGAEELGRSRHDDIRPATLVRALLEGGAEVLSILTAMSTILRSYGTRVPRPPQ